MKHHCAATPVAAFFFLLGAVLGAPAAQASARVGLDPIELTLRGRDLAASVNLTNEGKAPVTFQVELLAWSQVDGRDVLTPTRDLIVAPPVFRVPVGGRQTIRVGRLQRVTPGPVEKTYRLAITEIPAETEVRPDVIATALRVTIPVFTPPATPLPPTFTWQGAPDGKGGLALVVTNAGNTTVRVRGLALLRDGATLVARRAQFGVLPGITRTIPMPDVPPGVLGGGPLEIETELVNRRKLAQPLPLGALPAAAPRALPPTLITPTSGTVTTPLSRL